MWKDFLKNTLLKPGLERLGTIAVTAMIFGGDWLCQQFEACGLVTQGGAELVWAYVTGVALLLVDVLVIIANRRKAKR